MAKSLKNLLARYQSGEHAEVWNELRSHGAIEGDLLLEARVVAEETMKRVAHNADLVGERLAACGWEPLYGQRRTHPQPGDADILREIEEFTGAPLPISLRAFWENVGGINFTWGYNRGEAMPDLAVDLPMDEMDPLCVDAPDVVAEMIEVWEEQKLGEDMDMDMDVDVDPSVFSVYLSPDYLHKANVSGGPHYAIDLPFLGADPLFANELHNLPFVDYLRLSFKWGAFSRLELNAERADVQEFLQSMKKAFEPF